MSDTVTAGRREVAISDDVAPVRVDGVEPLDHVGPPFLGRERDRGGVPRTRPRLRAEAERPLKTRQDPLGALAALPGDQEERRHGVSSTRASARPNR